MLLENIFNIHNLPEHLFTKLTPSDINTLRVTSRKIKELFSTDIVYKEIFTRKARWSPEILYDRLIPETPIISRWKKIYGDYDENLCRKELLRRLSYAQLTLVLNHDQKIDFFTMDKLLNLLPKITSVTFDTSFFTQDKKKSEKKISAAIQQSSCNFSAIVSTFIASQPLKTILLNNTACYQHLCITIVLLQLGSDVNLANNKGNTPLHCAAYNGNEKMVKILIHAKAQINLRNKEGETPFMMACMKKHKNLTTYLYQSGANINIPDRNLITPLCHCISMDHIEMAQMLLLMGASVNIIDKDGNSALSLSIRPGLEDFVSLLLLKGANPNPPQGISPIWKACGQTPHIFCALLAHIPDPNLYNPSGDTLLIHAVRKGCGSSVLALLVKGADTTLKSRDGQTAYNLASELKYTHIVELFQTTCKKTSLPMK